MIDPKLLNILACPLCEERPPLREEGEFLVCTQCSARYPVVNNIPQLLPESALLDEVIHVEEGVVPAENT